MAVLPMSRMTDSSFGIAPRILVTLRKSFCSRSIQFVAYIIDWMDTVSKSVFFASAIILNT